MNLVYPGDAVTSERHNALIEGIRQITISEAPLPPVPDGLAHQWQCRVAPGAADGEWNVFMSTGFVNDLEATVAYLTEGDPRGWTMPKDYPPSRIKGGIANRLWRETDQPPYLLLTSGVDFTPVADSARPDIYQNEAAWKKKLSVATIYLCALPLKLSGRQTPTSYRTWGGRIPSQNPYPYGLRHLARVYLLEGEKPGDASATVEQLEFWGMHCVPIDPVTILPDYQPIGDPTIDLFGALELQQINEALANNAQAASTVEFWTA